MASCAGTVRKVKQEARLRRSGHHNLHNAPPTMPPNPSAEVEGYGPYKPVPPPKPLSTYSPPPYRMPPYPLYGDTAIPGAAATEPGTSGLHTHSSKFPIEREVILSSADKNSKIPILHEYKKQRPKSASAATIAPEGPSKQVAWTEDKKGHMMQIQDGHRGAKPSLSQDYRSPYHGVNGVTEGPYHYNGQHGGSSTGAVPRTWTANGRMDDGQDNCRGRTQGQQFQSQSMAGRSPAPLPHHNGQPSNAENAKISSEYKSGDVSQDPERGNGELGKDGSKDGDKNKAFPTRTYHTIKDMISSRFGSGKGPKEGEAYSANMAEQGIKNGENSQNGATALNNIPNAGGEGSPRKNSHNSRMVPKDDDLELSQRQQHMLGGGPQQTLASTRREGVYQSPHAAARRIGDAASENARGHSDQQSVYVPPQEHQGGRIPAEYPSGREYVPQQQENLYNYGSQRHQTMPKPQNQRFANQQSVLEQNGIYMVMRQGNSNNPQQGYQHAVPASTINAGAGNYQSGHYGNKESQYGNHEQGQQKTESQPSGDIRRQNIVGVLEGRGFSAHDGSRQAAESSNYGTTNAQGAKRTEPQSSGNQGRRGSIPQLDEDDDEGGFVMGIGRGSAGAKSLRSSSHSRGGDNFANAAHPQSSGQSSDYEKATQRSTGQSSSNADSGRGSTIYSGGHQASQGGLTPERLDTSTESSDSPQVVGNRRDGIYGLPSNLATANDSEWVDIVESELRQILDPKMHGLGHTVVPTGTNSTLSESISSLTPPLPPLSPGGGSSPSMSPQNSRYKHGSRKASQSGGGGMSKSLHVGRGNSGGNTSANMRSGWSGRGSSKNQLTAEKQHRQSSKKSEQLLSTSAKGNKIPLSASVFGLDTTDLTSTTTGLDSMLEGNTENNSSDDDLSTTIDATDAHTIRKQLEGLENMYSEVLKLLGVKKYGGRYQPSDPRINKRRLYGSMSSLPSSVSSRPMRDKRRQDDRKKVKDIKGINKRFQRLESHVVTLARSVAHLSSEMRTQHLMIQEMENIRGEISALRSQTLAARSQSMPRGLNNLLASGDRDAALPALTNPTRVKKLTKFFGDEPPLLRLFLKKLGYEKYAGTFEQERVGMVELPYLTEERLQKMGIPLGPRLRILQEAQISVCRDKVYVV